MKKLLALAIVSTLCLTAFGQSKSETKHYNESIARNSLEAYNSFIKRYPRSTYIQDILARKDTLLNICPYSLEDACSIVRQFMGPEAQVVARAARNNAVDHIDAVGINADSLAFGSLRVMSMDKPVGGEWDVKYSYDTVLLDAEEYDSLNFVDGYDIDRINSKDHFIFSCLFSQKSGSEQLFMALAYCPADDKVSKVFFLGRDILKEDETGYHILGRQSSLSSDNSPVLAYLSGKINDNDRLEIVSDADFYTDEAIRFWIENNPDALTKATKITASLLPKKSSLVEKYNASKKTTSSKYIVAQLNFRGYTMLVAYQKSTGQYQLFWVEPECNDRKNGRLLNNISFRDENTLEMYYYEGSKYFKYQLNLASKTLRR